MSGLIVLANSRAAIPMGLLSAFVAGVAVYL
jgi:hypothetical protein